MNRGSEDLFSAPEARKLIQLIKQPAPSIEPLLPRKIPVEHFSRLQSQTLDEMERLGTRLIDNIRLGEGTKSGVRHEAA